jgi:hypothetical protein
MTRKTRRFRELIEAGEILIQPRRLRLARNMEQRFPTAAQKTAKYATQAQPT